MPHFGSADSEPTHAVPLTDQLIEHITCHARAWQYQKQLAAYCAVSSVDPNFLLFVLYTV